MTTEFCDEEMQKGAVEPVLQHALRIIGSNIVAPIESDEFRVAESIKRKLVRKGREKDAAIFSELHRHLQAQGVLRQRWSTLYFLLALCDTGSKEQKSKFGTSSAMFGIGLPSHATSTPFNPALHNFNTTPGAGENTTLRDVTHSTGTSGISSIRSEISSGNPTPIPQSYMPVTTFNSIELDRTNHGTGRNYGAKVVSALSRTGIKSKDTTVAIPGRRNVSKESTIVVHKNDKTIFELPESELIRDLVYAFQGIEGKWIKFDPSKEGYRIDQQAGIPKGIRQLVCKLAECGWLYSKTKNYVQSKSSDKTFGLVGQSFCSALHQELTEYYRLLAVLEGQINQSGVAYDSGDIDGISLRQMIVWTFDPLVRLKCLATLVDVCKGKKGGALASSLYSYMQHGDPFIKTLIMHILTMVSQPIYVVLIRWVYDGELEDTFDEFFVAADPTIKNDRLWHEKYSLRKSMIPNFLSFDQAKRILLTGKSINFLRQVCQDRTPITGREIAMKMDTSHADKMFRQDTTSEFQTMIDTVYKETSRHLLDVLHNKYKFMEHLKAMRRYLLLGQGDFIRHLMDLLEEDLAKPAGNLYLHNLTGILESAIRATNAQYDDADILKRLDVRILEISPGDTGWDVFSLDYHVDGPIRTVFTPDCMIKYLRVFNFLWRAKRMEYILAIVWKNQISNARHLKSIPELSGILHQCQVLVGEMFHFVQQVQYYINFEVLECSWDELLNKVKEAEDLDHIIAAHQVFLNTIISRCLLDEESKNILTQMRTTFDLIIQFQGAQEVFYKEANDEIEIRLRFDKRMEQRTHEGDWAITEAEEIEEKRRRRMFLKKIIPNTRAQIKVLSQSYQDMVQQFLAMVTAHEDVSLRFLSFRLDFNEHYKAKDPRLQSPFARKTTSKVMH